MELCLKYLGVYNVCWIHLSCAHTPGGVRTGYHLSCFITLPPQFLKSVSHRTQNLPFLLVCLANWSQRSLSLMHPSYYALGLQICTATPDFSMGTEDLHSGSSFWCSYPLSISLEPLEQYCHVLGSFPPPQFIRRLGITDGGFLECDRIVRTEPSLCSECFPPVSSPNVTLALRNRSPEFRR